jgi:hypothetical protein
MLSWVRIVLLLLLMMMMMMRRRRIITSDPSLQFVPIQLLDEL